MYSRLVKGVWVVTAVTLFFAHEQAANAQIRPGGAGMPTGPQQGPKPKKDGVAEKAPDQPGTLPTTPVLRPPSDEDKRFEIRTLDGFFRFRADWFKNLHLGFNDDPTLGGAPFRRPLACIEGGAANKPCDEAIKTANIKLRLEPTIHIDRNKSVHFQVDVLDNLVLGATPDGRFWDGTSPPTNIPIGAFTGGQVAPEAGRNYLTDSIVVKQAWAEIRSDFGLLKFGRMPSHWGLGILANSGGYDPIHGTYQLDSDYQDIADRIMIFSGIPGTQLRFGVGTDWVVTSPSSAQTDIQRNRFDGQPWDLEDADDVHQWIFVVAKLDSPRDWKNKLELNGSNLNYGAYFVYRTQEWDYNPTGNLGQSPSLTPERLVPRGATAYIPDFWIRYAYKNFEFEFEGVGIFGEIKSLNDLGISGSLDIRQFGAVAKASWTVLDNKMKLGLEVGYASGDQWDNEPQGTTNVRDARALPGPGDNTVSAFRFDFNYYVDLILFRELLGTVTNATYVKPTMAYKLTDSITGSAAAIASFANVPVATPGNGTMYGVEFDFDVGYASNGFFAGLAYGIFVPLSAMHHPADPGFGYGAANIGDAGNAQTIQARLILQF